MKLDFALVRPKTNETVLNCLVKRKSDLISRGCYSKSSGEKEIVWSGRISERSLVGGSDVPTLCSALGSGVFCIRNSVPKDCAARRGSNAPSRKQRCF